MPPFPTREDTLRIDWLQVVLEPGETRQKGSETAPFFPRKTSFWCWVDKEQDSFRSLASALLVATLEWAGLSGLKGQGVYGHPERSLGEDEERCRRPNSPEHTHKPNPGKEGWNAGGGRGSGYGFWNASENKQALPRARLCSCSEAQSLTPEPPWDVSAQARTSTARHPSSASSQTGHTWLCRALHICATPPY